MTFPLTEDGPLALLDFPRMIKYVKLDATFVEMEILRCPSSLCTILPTYSSGRS